MKYTFEWCGLPNCYINQQLTYLLALKRGWGSKHSLQSSGPTSAQLLKDKEHSPEPEMGMQLGRSGLKPSRINLAARICTNIFSISLKTTEAATISLCLPCRKSWGTAFFFFFPHQNILVSLSQSSQKAAAQLGENVMQLLFGFCLSQKATNILDYLTKKN